MKIYLFTFNQFQGMDWARNNRLGPKDFEVLSDKQDLYKLQGIEHPICLFQPEWHHGSGWANVLPRNVYRFIKSRRGTVWHQLI